MDIARFLSEATVLPGLPGREAKVAEYIAAQFEPLADDVRMDVMHNVMARHGQGGPRILLAAHQDEIGLVVSRIEKDGALRLTRSGGVDPRILPASEVVVWTKGGPMMGIVGAKAPHLLTDDERKKNTELKDLFVDMGMAGGRVRETVRIGDMVTLTGAFQQLASGCAASKTMDDRAGVACMLCALEELTHLRARAETYFVATGQEEIGAGGALTAAYSIAPDIGIAIDVTHGEGPGTGKFDALPLDKVAVGKGPSLHAELTRRLQEAARKHKVDIAVEISDGHTWTDADAVGFVREGVPCVLVSIPLKYMHTTVETLKLDTIREAGRLIAHFIDDISRDWEAIAWY